ncbi:hypothetical protein O181_050223 [Austropuccinia psidii MF-1]|uniref:Uncharacterized protein n=1 Tax=Austropuccinia psidii MF-1 TaxID=1389203 RepID=A0A9Q3E1C8_9BASI|nr:hypothetical protein [Austropuccinia psidii MF-1]
MNSDEPSSAVMDLLALRLSSVPFNEAGHNQQFDPPSVPRWSPQVTTLSFVGTLTPTGPGQPVFHAQFSLPSFPAVEKTIIPVIKIPNTLVRGELPVEAVIANPSERANWLISGELCFVEEEFALVAQSLYQLNSLSDCNEGNQLSTTGFLSALIPSSRFLGCCNNPVDLTLDEALVTAMDPYSWYDGEFCERNRVTMADVEWIDISVEVGKKHPNDLTGWIQCDRELVSVKCYSSKKQQDRNRVLEYAASYPLVGQIIAIRTDCEMKTLFIQL